MKKKLLIKTFIPLLACFATIGSGFSLWIFSDTNSVSEEGVIKINTTKVVGIGDITVTNKETSKIILDQKNILNDSSTYELNPESKGCYIENPQDVSYKFDSSKYEAYGDFVIGFDSNETDLIFTTIIKIPAEIYKYIGFYCAAVPLEIAINNGVTGTTLEKDNDGNVTFTYVDSFAQTNKTEDDLKAGFSFLTWKEHIKDESSAHLTMSVQYNDGWVFGYNSSTQKYETHYDASKSTYPTSLNEYKTMLNAIKGKSIDITYQAKVIIKE